MNDHADSAGTSASSPGLVKYGTGEDCVTTLTKAGSYDPALVSVVTQSSPVPYLTNPGLEALVPALSAWSFIAVNSLQIPSF